MYSKLLMFIFCLSLQSCVTYQDSTVEVDVFKESQKKSVIGLRLYAIEEGLFFDSTYFVDLTLSKVDSNYLDRDKRFRYRVNACLSPCILMMDAGIYVIEDISWTEGRKTYSSTNDGITKDGFLGYGAIDLKENEIYDLGNWLFRYQSGKIIMKAHTKYEPVSKVLSSRYPDLSKERGIKKPKMFRAGSYLKLQQLIDPKPVN